MAKVSESLKFKNRKKKKTKVSSIVHTARQQKYSRLINKFVVQFVHSERVKKKGSQSILHLPTNQPGTVSLTSNLVQGVFMTPCMTTTCLVFRLSNTNLVAHSNQSEF